MKLHELEVQAKALAPVLKGLVERAIESFRIELAKDLAERDSLLNDSAAEMLKSAQPDLAEIARSAAALVEPGKDGASVDPDDLQRLVAEEVKNLPAPKDGLSVTIDDVLPFITEQIAAAVAAIPLPKDGADVDPELVRQAIADEVGKLPPPQDGTSVTLEDVAPLIQERIVEAVALIPAPLPGKDGESVSVDQVKAMVDEAVARAIGQIQMPNHGEPGRDALDLEILPEIDEAKSYVRGTYAKHLGGLWRSFERTAGLKGWECIVEGVAALKVEQDGERGIKAVAQLSSGAFQEAALTIESMIYRGVFAPGAYVKGDTVTWGGSLWHCDEQTSDKPGEPGSKGWRLAVKKGRDGKDGINGKDLTKGVSLP